MKRFDTPNFIDRYLHASETSESPLEQVFQMMLEKYLHPDAKLIPQAPMRTRRANFRADWLLVTATGERLVLECDGKDYHDPLRDAFRDAFMLADDLADFVYRFPGYVVNNQRIWHALFALYFQQPGVFSRRGEYEIRTRCHTLADPATLDDSRFAQPPQDVNHSEPKRDWEVVALHAPSSITVRAGRNRRGAPLFGVELIDYARKNPGKTLDELVEQVYGEIRRSA